MGAVKDPVDTSMASPMFRAALSKGIQLLHVLLEEKLRELSR